MSAAGPLSGYTRGVGQALPSVDIVVPVYNEEASIWRFIDRVTAIGLRQALLFVDNGSSDGTVERIASYPCVRLIRHPHNMGYGASIRDGLRATTARHIVIIDADLEYPPEAIPQLVSALDRHPVVYGSRFADPALSEAPWIRRHGNGVITQAFNLLFGQQLTDLYTGMKAIRRDVLDALSLQCDGFSHVAEMAVDLARAGYRIAEVPVAYAPRAQGTSKMRHVRETIRGCSFIVMAWLTHRLAVRR